MTELITYEHTAAVTLDLPVMINSLAVSGEAQGLQVTHKANKGTTIINDPNIVARTFQFNCVLSRTNTATLLTYLQPAAAITYGDYPRFSKFYTGDATDVGPIKVVRVSFSYRPYGRDATDIQYLWTLVFKERF